ncbi:MAG: hypothetical protein ACOCUH_01690 [Bacteriovoracia bacterium]
MIKFCIIVISSLFLTSCAYLAGYNLYLDVWNNFQELDIRDHENLEKYSSPIVKKMPYLNCWGSFYPLPLSTQTGFETVYGLEGTILSCSLDAMESSAKRENAPLLHHYFVVSPNEQRGGFFNWGALAGSKIMEKGTFNVVNMKRHGAITAFKKDGRYGIFVFKEGMIARYSPFVLKTGKKQIKGRFGKKEVHIKEEHKKFYQTVPETKEELEEISSLIPGEYRRKY